MRQYSIDKVELSWNGLDFKEGLAKGSTIKEARASKSWTSKQTGMGKIVRIYNPDRSGSITITVDQESKLHQQLGVLALVDQTARNIVFPMTMTDNSTGEVFAYTNTFIESDPDEQRGTESATFDWVFLFEAKAKVPAPKDQNLIGA